MKRKTAYEIAIEALEEKQRRNYAFDHHVHEKFAKAGYRNEPTMSAHKNFVRIDQAIEILEGEKDCRQLTLGGE